MELEIMYPNIIIYSLIISFVVLFVWKGSNEFKKGVLVANTKYIKGTKYYHYIMVKYRIITVIVKIVCILAIFCTSLLTSRFYEEKIVGEEVNNRDIMICMDISGSVNNLNRDLIGSLKETIKTLHNERFGITVFDSMPFELIPLTTDYQYVLSILEQVGEALNTKYNPFATNSKSYIRDFLYGGEYAGEGIVNRGYSLVGDGLATCANSFKKNDDRTKVIVLTTDNEVIGEEIVTVKEAAAFCKKNNIKIYSIGTKTIYDDEKKELMEISNMTDGVYYDYKDYSTNSIVNEIEKLSKSNIVKNSYNYTVDYPEKFVFYLVFLIPLLFLLEWRINS